MFPTVVLEWLLAVRSVVSLVGHELPEAVVLADRVLVAGGAGGKGSYDQNFSFDQSRNVFETDNFSYFSVLQIHFWFFVY